MGQQNSEQKITRAGKKSDKVQTALAELERKLVRGQVNDRFSVRINPISPKKLISFKVKF